MGSNETQLHSDCKIIQQLMLEKLKHEYFLKNVSQRFEKVKVEEVLRPFASTNTTEEKYSDAKVQIDNCTH